MTRELHVRTYNKDDIPVVINMICHAIPQLPNYSMITPDRERVKYVLEHNIDNGVSFGGWVLCDSHEVPHGMAGGWCVHNLMSLDLVADDIFMWIEPQFRTYKYASQLLKVYVEWAKARGAKLIRASHTGGSFPKGSREAKLFDELLRRVGFQDVGTIYHLSTYGEK